MSSAISASSSASLPDAQPIGMLDAAVLRPIAASNACTPARGRTRPLAATSAIAALELRHQRPVLAVHVEHRHRSERVIGGRSHRRCFLHRWSMVSAMPSGRGRGSDIAAAEDEKRRRDARSMAAEMAGTTRKMQKLRPLSAGV